MQNASQAAILAGMTSTLTLVAGVPSYQLDLLREELADILKY